MNAPWLFIDQSGQLGGAELCLLDIVSECRESSAVLLFDEGPFGDRLRERGIELTVLSAGQAILGVRKTSRFGERCRGLLAMPVFLAHLRRATAGRQLLYFNTAKALVLGKLARRGAIPPSIFHLHDLLVETHFHPANIQMLVRAANRVQTVIANSRATADAFRAAGGRVPVEVVPNGFEPSRFGINGRAAIQDLRAKWNPHGLPVVSVFGRIARWKGQEVLLQAVARLKNVMVWVVGDALYTQDDAAYAASLRALVVELGMEDRVHFAGHQDDVPLWMQASDVIVHSSIVPEPFGRVVVEGMLSNRPVVAADAGGPAEILQHGETGLLVPPGDSTALANVLRELIDDPSLRQRLADNARKHAESEYALAPVMAHVREIIDHTLAL